jgi:outer membrane protein TolC
MEGISPRCARAALLACLTCLIVLPPGPGRAEPVEPESVELGPESGLRDYLRLAEARSPALAAVYQRWQAVRERVTQASAWPDPIVRYGYFAQEVETALGPQKHRIGLSQTVPWFGKSSLRGEIQTAAARAAEQHYRAARLELFARVARAYYELAHLSRAVEVTEGFRVLLTHEESLSRTRFRTGLVTNTDLIKAQVELAALEDRLSSLRDRRRPLSAQLNAALGRPAGAQLPWPVPLVEPPSELPDDSEVLERVRTSSPELAALDREIQADERSLALARRERFPDVTLGVETIVTDRSSLTDFSDSGQDAWIASLSFPFPVSGKYGAAIREAEAQRTARLRTREDLERELAARAELALYELRDAERRMELYDTALLPKAQQALGAATSAYRAASLGFLELLDAQRLLLRFELDLARARADRGQRVVELLSMMGVSPSGVEDMRGRQP